MNILKHFPGKDERTSSYLLLLKSTSSLPHGRDLRSDMQVAKEELQAFLDQVLKAEDFDIVLTGQNSEFEGIPYISAERRMWY